MNRPKPSGTTINIYTASTDVPKCSSTEPKPTRIVQKKSVDSDVERGDALDIELMNRDNIADDEKMDLEQRVTLYVRDLLYAKKSSILREFLDKAKHHFDGNLKESISNEISESKKEL